MGRVGDFRLGFEAMGPIVLRERVVVMASRILNIVCVCFGKHGCVLE